MGRLLKNKHIPLTVLATILVVALTFLTSLAIFYVVKNYEIWVKESAAATVLETAVAISKELAKEEALIKGSIDLKQRENLLKAVSSLKAVYPALSYVSVWEKDALLYNIIPQGQTNAASKGVSLGKLLIEKKNVVKGANTIPVLTFSFVIQQDGSLQDRKVEIAFEKYFVDEKLSFVQNTIKKFFFTSLSILIIAFLIILCGIIWLIRRELRWQENIKMQEHSNFVSSLTASILHDLRNPMSAMKLDSQLIAIELSKGEKEHLTKAAKLAARITSTLDRMESLLKEFLLLSSDSILPEKVSLIKCIEECVDILKPQLERKRLKIELKCYSENDVLIESYPVSLRRAVLNILSNAQHFSPENGTIKITLNKNDAEATIQIEDEGPGVPPEEHSKIFELFYSRRPGGTGLGLSFAKVAIERCGGTITLLSSSDNKLRKGSVFNIRLPLKIKEGKYV